MLIYNELPTAFPWYDKLGKQQRYREHAKKNCDYNLISPNDGLLPFQVFLGDVSPEAATKWEIMTISDVVAIDISNNISRIKYRVLETGFYVYFSGGALTFSAGGVSAVLDLPIGKYYSRITFGSGKEYFSEVFTIPEERFLSADPSKYVKLEYWNTCDLNPILYNLNGAFKQVLYVDTFIHTSEPEIEEDGERDGYDQLIPSFQKLTVKYRFTAVVPDFIKIALVSMQMHDNVYLSTENELRTGRIERMTTTATIENGGAFSNVDVVLEQIVIAKTSCCENMALVAHELNDV